MVQVAEQVLKTNPSNNLDKSIDDCPAYRRVWM